MNGASRLAAFDSALIFFAALAFYAWTLAPTVVWSDSAALAQAARFGSLRLATAGDHPLFVLVGRGFARLPGELARNINLEAAVFGALAVMLVYKCGRALGASRPAALVGAAALSVSHAFWLNAVIAEVYTANAFFLGTTLYLLIRWRQERRWIWLAAAAAAIGIGLTNHIVLATMVPASLVFVMATGHRGLLIRRSLTWFAVAAAVVLAAAFVRRAPVAAALRKFWYGPPGIGEYLTMNFDMPATAREAAYYALYLGYQFPSASLALVLVGIWAVLRDQRAVAALLLLTIAVNAATFVHHTVWPSAQTSKYVFYIADYVVFSIFCGLGAHRAIERLSAGWNRRRRVWAFGLLTSAALLPPCVYAIAPTAAKAAGLDLLHARRLPYRDNDRYFLNPNKRGEYSARRFGEEALRVAKPGAVIFADYTPYTVLQYLMLTEGQRPDVKLVSPTTVGGTVPVSWTFDAGRRRPVYLAALTPGYYDLSGLAGGYDLVPAGPMLEVCPR